MKNKALNTVNKYKMFENVEVVVVGFSGGADSTALLHFLHSIQSEYNFKIVSAHINHNLRGQEAKRDEIFARDFSKSLNIDFKLLDVDVEKIAKQENISVELCARNIRYDFFKSICKEYKNIKIATAHTSTDNAETVIYNITRGSGIKGICGIPPIRDNIIRPIIECSRHDIENYCKINNLEYVTDSTNLTDDYTRNNIRHNVLSVLKQINPNLEKSINILCENARENQEYINNQVNEVIKESKKEYSIYDVKVLKNCHIEILKNVIIKILNENKIYSYSNPIVNDICKVIYKGFGAVDVNNFKRIIVKQNMLRLIEEEENNVIFSEKLNINSKVIKFNKQISLKVVDIEKFEILVNFDKKVLKNALDYDIIKADLILRNRRQGDKFTLSKRNITKSLKKLFNEEKIPQEIREKIFLIEHESEIIWIENIGVSVRGKVTPNTKNVLIIDIDFVG